MRVEISICTAVEESLSAIALLETTDGPVSYDYETWGDRGALRPELCREYKVLCVGGARWHPDREDVVQAFGILLDSSVPDYMSPEDLDRIVEAWRAFLIHHPRKVVHNASFEHKVNKKRFGRSVHSHDTMLMLRNVDENIARGYESLGLIAELCEVPWADYKEKSKEIQQSPETAEVKDLLTYVSLDAATTLVGYSELWETLNEEDLLHVVEQDEEFCQDIVSMEMAGRHVDERTLKSTRTRIESEVNRLRSEFASHPVVVEAERTMGNSIKSWREDRKFNPNSPSQMKHLVLKVLKEKITDKTTKGDVKLDKTVLERISDKHEVLKILSAYRSLSSMLTGFLNKWEHFTGETGCVHTQYNQATVVTGRLSSSNPNLQNIPKRGESKAAEIRRVFASRFPGGYVICADYKQQEPRLVAGISGDEKMIDAINGGLDLHRFVAGEIFEVAYDEVIDAQRDIGKRMNLGIIYGQTEYGLATKTKMSVVRARELLDKYDRQFSGVARYRDDCHHFAMLHGYVEDLFGARRHLPDAQSTNEWRRSRALRQSSNFPIQGTAYRFIMIALRVARELIRERAVFGSVICGQEHDSLISECSEEDLRPTVQALTDGMLVHNDMDYWRDRKVPMEVEITAGPNLFEQKDVRFL